MFNQRRSGTRAAKASDNFDNADNGDNGDNVAASDTADAFDITPKPLSKTALKSKAVRLLALREYTRAELLKKLKPLSGDLNLLEEVLDELAQGGWQSDERFATAFSHHKASKQGAALVAQGMRQKGVPDALIAQTLQSLRDSESSRARAVWEKKFSREGRPSDARAWARQARFLASRGFASSVIRQVLGSDGEDSD